MGTAKRRECSDAGGGGHIPSDERRFLTHVWRPLRSGLIEIRVLPNNKGKGKNKGVSPLQRWFDDIEGALAFASQFDDKRNGYSVYFGVSKRARRGGRKQDVLGATVLWADIDTVNLGWNTRVCIRKIRGLPDTLRPSALLHSGGGLHAYWFLQAPLLAPAQTPLTEQANAVLATLVGGDAVGNIDRIMRLPGSWNAKRGIARARRCCILYCEQRMPFDARVLMAAAQEHGPLFEGPQFTRREQLSSRRRAGAASRRPTLPSEPRVGLDELWAKQVRYHATGAKRLGVNEAIAVTTARLHCLGWKDAAIIADVLQRVRRIQAAQAPCERWDWEAERKAIHRSLARWKPKWRALRNSATRAMTEPAKATDGFSPMVRGGVAST